MVIMAGMLPGVECARRRRRLRQGGTAETPCGTRRRSFCLHANGHDHPHLGSSGSECDGLFLVGSNYSKLQQRSSVCKDTTHAWTTLDSNAREAKERLDQKLRSQRESVVKSHLHHSTGSLRLPAKSPASTSTSTSDGDHSANVLQREVFSNKGGGGSGRRRFSWGRLGWKAPQRPPEQPECAVCLEEFRAGDVLVHLPCGHRFHWPCAVPWVQAASRCPFCRAAVDVTSSN